MIVDLPLTKVAHSYSYGVGKSKIFPTKKEQEHKSNVDSRSRSRFWAASKSRVAVEKGNDIH